MEDDGNSEGGGAGRWEPRPDLIPPGILQPPTQAVPATPEPEPTAAVPPAPSGPPTPPQGQPLVDAAPPLAPSGPPTATTGAPPPEDPDRRRRLIIAASALGVVAALILGFVVFRIATGDDDTAGPTPSTSSTSSSSTSTSTTVGSLSGRVDLGQGITAIVPEGALSPGATLVADPSQLPGDAAGVLVAVSPFVQIRVEDGEQRGPITLEFPVAAPAAATPEAGDPALVALRRGEGIDPVAGTFDAAAGTYTVTAEALDGWGVAGWIWDQVTDAVDDAVRARTDGLADAADPSCGTDAADLVEADTAEGGPAWCAEVADDGTRTLRLVNRVDHLVTVTWGEGTNAAPDGGGQLADALERWVDEADGTGSLALAPGEAAQVSIPADVEGTVDVAYDSVAHAATSMLVAADVVAATTELASFAGPAADAGTVLGGVDVAGCLGGAWKAGDLDAALPADIVAACFSEASLAGTLDPKVAALVLPLLPSATLAGALTDAWADGTTAMTADAASTFTVATAAGPWPTDDQEADVAYTSWLLLDGFIADWSSCSGDLCIAGDGDQVRVDDVSGFEPEGLGTVPEDTTDAQGALVGLGLTDDEATALLTPGPA